MIEHAPLPVEAQLQEAQATIARVRAVLAHWERMERELDDAGFKGPGRVRLRSCMDALRAALEGKAP